MRQHRILAFVFLVVFVLLLDVNANVFQYPEGDYKYQPARKPSAPSSRSSVPGNVSTPSFTQGDTYDFERLKGFSKNSSLYKLSRAVAFVFYEAHGKTWGCSGFLVGPDLLLTNYHCVYDEYRTPYPLQTYIVSMDYYEEGNFGNVTAYVKKILARSKALDYALLQLNTPLGNTRGWLKIDTSTPSRNSNVVIIQHPNGEPKQVVRSNSLITQVYSDMIHYEADTKRGSSGSAVFKAGSNKVIAIHHHGIPNQYNEGVLMKKIYPQIKPFIQDAVKRDRESKVIAPLDITSTPSGATVYIDGTRVGTTPLRGHEVDTGQRGEKRVTVRLERNGYKILTTQITLAGGKSKTWNGRLENVPAPRKPQRTIVPTAPLDITSTPSGATVYIDGTQVGTTPLRGHEVDTGQRGEKRVTVRLERNGYKILTTQITLAGGKSKTWSGSLEKVPVQLKPQATVVESKAKMVLIPAGKFRMGTDQSMSDESKPIHTVYLDAFYIDKYEVTVGEYKQFLLDSGHPSSLHPALSQYSPTDDHPIVMVSWHDAIAYAQWAGKRLPTEAEWEKAARSGLMDMRYPWGNDAIDSSKANYGEIHDGTMPVGSHPPNAFGLYDMTGNAMEWCLDPWDGNFYAKSPAENPFAGQKSQDATIADYKNVRGLRVVRGGSWSQKVPATFWVSGRFKADSMKKTYSNIGFRCVKDAP